MATNIRPEVSKNNKYWIDKHRHYELKHFCMQYGSWKKAYADILESNISLSRLDSLPGSNTHSDLTAKYAILKSYYSDKIHMVERAAITADPYLGEYILKAVTEGLSYTYLKSRLNIPCSRDLYYDRYRKFFWILNKSRN